MRTYIAQLLMMSQNHKQPIWFGGVVLFLVLFCFVLAVPLWLAGS